MKKLKKSIIIAVVIVFVICILTKTALATNVENIFESVQYSEDFKKWLNLPEDERKNIIPPRMYDIIPTNSNSQNILYNAQLVGAISNSRYSLKDVIPENLSIRNQEQTQLCWALASLSSLETNLALSNYKNGTNTQKVYDFSERHMEYATSKYFSNNVENPSGYNRKVGSGGFWYLAESYLTNGQGAIDESDMPFENNENIIDINEIQNKNVSSQVYDTVDFANYRYQTEEKKAEIMNEIKQHIQNYGSVYAGIHGNSSNISMFNCYNNSTGAKYCNSTVLHGADHAVSIIGWDDNYSKDNFAESTRPNANGAWIIRNSWGERYEAKVSELKDEIFNTYKQECINSGWNSSSEIPNSFIENIGYTIENDMAYITIGDNGIMYVSYEDCNISNGMYGIIKASDTVDYDNIYQYDDFYPGYYLSMNSSKTLVCNIFDKKNIGTEYLTQVALYAPETYKCKVYVNPNGTSKSKNDMQLVELKSGESETFNQGYHTLEFAKPVQIIGSKFAVVVEIEGTRSYNLRINLETKLDDFEEFNSIKVETGKCFIATTNDFDNCEWIDLGMISTQVPTINSGDSTIKAFTVNELMDGSLKNVEITTPPNKTNYFEGDDFDKTGMVVKANYNRKTNPTIILDDSSYNITNGTNLKEGQTSVTITYEGKSVEQPIVVEKNNVIGLDIKNPPLKTEYKEGQPFDKAGMVVEARYKDGTTKEISDYIIKDGNNLNENQTSVTISYGGIEIEQEITVLPNPLIEINITKAPDKVNYVVGQDFDKTGMIITGTYQDGSKYEIIDYTIENGTDLVKEQESVIIKFKGKMVEQSITVEEKRIVSIEVSKMPSKTKYIQSKEELDLSDGLLKINYNDNSSEEIALSSEKVKISGFNNNVIGKNTINIEYEDKSTTFDIEVIEEAKPQNSNFDSVSCKINSIRNYTFSDSSKNSYIVIDLNLDKIKKYNINDSYEYYYYLSLNPNETNIEKWVKISKYNSSEDKLQFEINTSDINNTSSLASLNNLYLYIKEVAIKGGNQSRLTTKAIKLDSNVSIETYRDGTKINVPIPNNQANSNNNTNNTNNNNANNEKEVDRTNAPGVLPKTGVISVLLIIIVLTIAGVVFYVRYKKLSKYVK